jgi:hypothetical protein
MQGSDIFTKLSQLLRLFCMCTICRKLPNNQWLNSTAGMQSNGMHGSMPTCSGMVVMASTAALPLMAPPGLLQA